MHGYCGDCDEQIEFYEGNIVKIYDSSKNEISVYLKCPYCGESELMTKVNKKGLIV